MPQIRQNLTEYAILPLGSSFLREHLPEERMVPKSLLLYGPANCGKTMLAQAVAAHTGALFFDLSPSNLAGKFETSKGPVMLMHMVFKVAKNPQMAPVVIYIEEIDKLFVTSRKSDSAGRFKRDLITYKKWLEKKDSVIIIGNCREPWKMSDSSVREVKAFFDKCLYIPWPDYSSRIRIWKELIAKKLPRPIRDDFDFSTLARISEGYAAGSIVYTIKKTLTKRRVVQLRKRPLKEIEFINTLSRCEHTMSDHNEKFRSFTENVTNLANRRNQANNLGGGEDNGKKKKGGKKKKKKKK